MFLKELYCQFEWLSREFDGYVLELYLNLSGVLAMPNPQKARLKNHTFSLKAEPGQTSGFDLYNWMR